MIRSLLEHVDTLQSVRFQFINSLSNVIYQLIVTLVVISCDCAFPWVRTDYTIHLSTNCDIHKIDIYSLTTSLSNFRTGT